MTKILYMITNLAGGGAEKVLIDILRHTDYTKFDITLCLIENHGVYIKDLPKEVSIVYLYASRDWTYKFEFGLTKHLGMTFLQRRRIRRVINHPYDLVISFMEGIPVRFHDYIMDKGRKNYSWVHIDLLKKHYTAQYFSQREELGIYEKMDCVFFVSDDARHSFGKLFNVPTHEYLTIYNPIDRERIVALSTEFNPGRTMAFTFCTVGRLISQKSYDRILRLAKRLKSEGNEVKFWILGTGPLEQELKEMAVDLGVEDMVRFLGFHKNPYPYMMVADAFISTSMTEGYPLVICEALCLGKPILATDVTGPREILGKSEHGLLVDEDDESIYKGAVSLMVNNELRENLAGKAREKSSTFDCKKQVENIYNIIIQN